MSSRKDGRIILHVEKNNYYHQSLERKVGEGLSALNYYFGPRLEKKINRIIKARVSETKPPLNCKKQIFLPTFSMEAPTRMVKAPNGSLYKKITGVGCLMEI